MSQAQLLSLIGVLFALLVSMVAVIFNGLRERIRALESADNAAVLQSRLDALATDLAKLEGRFEQRTRDKDKSDFDWRHGEYSQAISDINLRLYPLPKQLEALEKRFDILNEWKHKTGDAYLPRAVDEHERRLNRLDLRVFNGHRES